MGGVLARTFKQNVIIRVLNKLGGMSKEIFIVCANL
jgi:hypothetical protein